MDTFEKTLNLIIKDMFMASLIYHAYYSISLAEEIQCYFSFMWGEKIYMYPNGLACLPHTCMFTALMKPVLRSQGYLNSGFFDDILL